MSHEERLKLIENVIRDLDIPEGQHIAISYYAGEVRIGRDVAQYIVLRISEMISAALTAGHVFYAWLDPQVGHIRIALSADGDLQKNFGAKIVIQKGFESMLDDIYEEGSLIEKNGGVRVHIADAQRPRVR